MTGSSLASSHRRQNHYTAQDQSSASLELPPYEQPKFPLNPEGQQKLRALSSNRTYDNYEMHMKKSAKMLATTVFSINERVTIRKKEASDMAEREAKRRRANGEDGEVELNNNAAAKKAKELEEKVAPLTVRAEEAMREVLDWQAALQDEQATLRCLPELVAGVQETKAAEFTRDDDEDADPPEIPGVPIQEILRTERDTKAAEYAGLNIEHKYVSNNLYINFKRSWHEGLYLNEEVVVPHPSTWFDSNGRPQHVINGAVGDDNESEDDVQVSREKRSYRCPLSLAMMTEPYTCRRCKHSFQKEAIFSYLGVRVNNKKGKAAKCPETGCHVNVSLTLIATDVSRKNTNNCDLGHDGGRPLFG